MKRNPLDYIIKINIVFVILFVVFQYALSGLYKLHYDSYTPYSRSEYKAKGGNTFDYYAGYVFFTSNVCSNETKTTAKFSLTGKTIFRNIYIIIYLVTWIMGLVMLDVISSYKKYNPSIYNLNEQTKVPIKVPTRGYYSWATFSLVISVYFAYYTLNYLFFFFLE